MPVPSPATELMMFKTLSAAGVTAFASVPVVFAVIEPMTWADVQARWIYIAISVMSAMVTLSVFQPNNYKELLGRILAAGIASLAFVEPVAKHVRPYLTDISLTDGAPIAAAMPAAVFIGIVAWFGFAFTTWAFRSPKRAFRIIYWWKSPSWQTFDQIFADDADTKIHPALPEESLEQMIRRVVPDDAKAKALMAAIQSITTATSETSTKGQSQGQLAIGVTLIPPQDPVKIVAPSGTVPPSDKANTTV